MVMVVSFSTCGGGMVGLLGKGGMQRLAPGRLQHSSVNGIKIQPTRRFTVVSKQTRDSHDR